ncbi:hypothetical protein BD310DRAFT_335171, partial [Dichomitus squalens]
AEASVVIWTLYLFAGRSVAILGIPPALGPAAEVVLMQDSHVSPFLHSPHSQC